MTSTFVSKLDLVLRNKMMLSIPNAQECDASSDAIYPLAGLTNKWHRY